MNKASKATATLLLAGFMTNALAAEQSLQAEPSEPAEQVEQAAQPLPPLTVEEAYQSALERNYALQSQEFIYRAEKEGVREAWGALLPQVEATAGYGVSEYTRDFDLQSSITENDAHSRYDLSVNQVVYSRRTFENLDRAKAMESLAADELHAYRLNIGYLAVEAYLQAAQLHAEALIIEREVENHEKRLQQLDSMRERGFASRADSLDAQARIDEVRAEYTALQSNYRAALKHLEAVTGLELDERELSNIPTHAWQATPTLIARDWVPLALANSGDVQKARGELSVAEATHDVERGAFWPELYLTARYTNNDTYATNLREEARLELQLRLPLYKGGSNLARARQAKERIHAGRYQLQDTENLVRVQVATVSEELRGSYSRIHSLRAAQESASAALQASERGFVGGVRSLNDLLDSRNRVSRVERNLAAELHTNLLLQFKLRQAAGTLSAADISSVFGG